MNKTKISIELGLVFILLLNFAFAVNLERSTAQIKPKEEPRTVTISNTNTVKATEVNQIPNSLPASTNFILVTDVLDGFGGQKYDGGCKLSVFAGGQSSPIGAGSSNNFKLFAGFIYPAVVKCGDANADGIVDVGDIVYLINYLFKGGPAPKPMQAGDTNCDGVIDVGDVVYLINYLFKGGPEPVC